MVVLYSFLPGQYDILTAGEPHDRFIIGQKNGAGNIILRGSGAAGAGRGGTTIKLNTGTTHKYGFLFETKPQPGGNMDNGDISSVVGTYARGCKVF